MYLYIPLHLSSCPFLEYPSMQTHSNDPLTLRQADLATSQLCFFVLHSSMSAKQNLMVSQINPI